MSFIPTNQKYTTSNVIGAAAYYGNTKIINFVMERAIAIDNRILYFQLLEFKAIDTGGDPNFHNVKDYTPLQLACSS